jgi:hypothetical protein
VSGHRGGGADPRDDVEVIAGQPAVLVWVLVISRSRRTLRPTRIAAPMPQSRESTGRPS